MSQNTTSVMTPDQILELLSKPDQDMLTALAADCNQVTPPKQLKSLWKGLQPNSTSVLPSLECFWRRLHLSKQLDQMAYPLSSKAILFRQQQTLLQEGESVPQFPYLITTLTSLLARQWCIWGIQIYLDLFNGNDATLNTNIIRTLQSPTDNQWWALFSSGNGILKWLSKQTITNPAHEQLIQTFETLTKTKPTWNEATERDVQQMHNVSGKGKPQPIKTTADLMKYLLRYRNALIHAEPLTEQDTMNAALALECLLQSSLILNPFVLRTKIDQQVFELRGMFPNTNNDFLPSLAAHNDRDLILHLEDQPLFSLSPLMTLAHDISIIDEAEDIFFINKGSVQALKYVGFVNGEHKDGQALGSYQAFKKYIATIPIPPGGTDNPAIDFTDFAADKSKYFVGRINVLNEIETAIEAGGGRYLFLKALAGMGKSAIMAHLFQLHYQNPEVDTEDDEESSDDKTLWLFHFCMHTNGRDQALTAYRSLIVQLQMLLGTYNKKRKPSMDVKEVKEQFQTLLNGSKEALEKIGKERIVVAIDALDETSFVEEDSIITCIPEFIQDHVTILCSYRVADDGVNQRVESRLQHLPDDKCQVLESANPLSGLSKQDVAAFLEKVGSAAPSEAMHETVWTAAAKDLIDFADPFYLRFVADGVEKKQYFLTRPETIPTSLNGAFEQMWLSLPSNRDFLAHRLLVTLGIMRDLGDDELFAELFSRQFNQEFTEEDIATIRRPIGKLLSYDGDRYGLFHDRFRFFLVGEQKDPIAEALALED